MQLCAVMISLLFSWQLLDV